MSIDEQDRKSNGNAAAVMVGGILIAVGVLMPWLIAWQPATGTIVQNGLGNGSGDGIIQLPLGITLAAFGLAGLAGSMSQNAQRWVGVPAVISLLIAFVDYQYISNKVANQLATGFAMQIGIGVYIVMAGAAVAVAGAGRTLRKRQGGATDADRA